jgi:hypothetical protein
VNVYGHKLSYELHHGAVPDGFVVMHKCDNPKCVNPAHLMLGTPADNTADMMAKGRYRTRHNVLDAQKVRAIRAADMSARELAEKYGCTVRTIQSVRLRETWKHVE